MRFLRLLLALTTPLLAASALAAPDPRFPKGLSPRSAAGEQPASYAGDFDGKAYRVFWPKEEP